MEISVSVNGVDHAVEQLVAYDAKAARKIDQAAETTARAVARRARVLAPKWIGELADSIIAEGSTVTVHAPYGEATEYGAAPHMPPVDSITPYALAHGIPPWALAIHIKRHGTPAQPFLRPAAEAERPAYLARVEKALFEASL